MNVHVHVQFLLLYLIMLSPLLPPHLHPWCYVCKSAVLCVWTPV